jgi:hypothetical protein
LFDGASLEHDFELFGSGSGVPGLHRYLATRSSGPWASPSSAPCAAQELGNGGRAVLVGRTDLRPLARGRLEREVVQSA